MSDKNIMLESFLDVIGVRCQRGLDTPHFLLNILKQSSLDHHIEVFKTVQKTPIGYVAWIVVNKETFIMMTKTKAMPSYPYEWNEGKLMIVYDVVFVPGWNVLAKNILMDFLFKKRFVAFLKRGRVRLWSKFNNKHKRRIY